MICKLFIYGSLAPGRSNEHVLAGIEGVWEPASIRGRLHVDGWRGYPGIDLDPEGEEVEGLLFSSSKLQDNWQRLDLFEAQSYKRVLAESKTAGGLPVTAFVYVLKH